MLAIPARPAVENGFVGLALTNPSASQEATPIIRELAADGSLLQPQREDSALQPSTQSARNSAEMPS